MVHADVGAHNAYNLLLRPGNRSKYATLHTKASSRNKVAGVVQLKAPWLTPTLTHTRIISGGNVSILTDMSGPVQIISNPWTSATPAVYARKMTRRTDPDGMHD